MSWGQIEERRAAREKREQDAAERITRAATITDQAAQERIASVLNHVYAEWANAETAEQADDITERLKQMGVSVSIAHYTGDSSYPTEYTISHPRATATGPTFDLALVEWIERLLQVKG